MSDDLVLNDLSVPLRALRTLAVDFPDLPAVSVHVSPVYPDRLELALHHDVAGFEAWRVALGISPDALVCHDQDGGRTICLRGGTTFAGADLTLTGYARLVRPTSPAELPAVAEPVAAGGVA